MEDSDDLQDIYGPQCWYGIEADLGGLKKATWLEIFTDFDCKALSAWLSCDDQREKAFCAQSLEGKRANNAAGKHIGTKELQRDVLHSQ